MDLAASSVRFRASTELMSGFGAPVLTAMPMSDLTRSTRLPLRTFPCLIRSSSADEAMMTMSIVSPRSSLTGIASCVVPIEGPNPTSILLPVARSYSGTS